MAKLQDLYDKRASVHTAMKELLDTASEGLSKEQSEKFDKMDDDFKALTSQIEAQIKLRDQERSINDKADKVVEDTPNVDHKASYKEAFLKYAKGQRLNDVDLKVLEPYFNAAQQTSTTTGGGYTIPEDFSGEVYETLKYYGPMLDFADVIRTNSGAPLPWPTNDDTSNSGYLLAENGDATSAATALTFGVKQLDAFNYTSGLIQVPKQLLQDEGVNFSSFLASKLGERLGRALNNATTRGNGSSQPQGFEDAATQGVLSASATAITATELIELEHSVDRAYRQSTSAGFMLHDSVLQEIKKLTVGDADDRPIWLPSYRDGEPDRLLGYRYGVNNDLDSSLAADARSVFFGDWSAHKIRIVNDMELLRLDERFAEKYQIGWVGFMRFDSELMDDSAIKFIRQVTS
jgi:HK97 family phage major capsid protein